ncbi:MAG: DsbE family thiol:disulfide interchange protein [Hyphomicrobium sp.]
MIADIGLYALNLALVVAVLQTAIPLAGAARRDQEAMSFGTYAAGLQLGFAVIALACLSQLQGLDNGPVDGMVLLLVFALISTGAAGLALRQMAPVQKAKMLGASGVVSLALLGFLIISGNPFARTHSEPTAASLRDFREFPHQAAGGAAVKTVSHIAPFSLPPVAGTGLVGLSDQSLKGQLTVLNVFASWCPGCRVEHPLLMKIASDKAIPLYGLNWKEKPGEGARFLELHKSPYLAAGDDPSGRTGVAMGVTGVPETLLVDATGQILYRHLGPLSEDTWKTIFEPLIERVRRGS